MTRRQFLGMLMLGAVGAMNPALSWSQNSTDHGKARLPEPPAANVDLYVVKVISFACKYCRESELGDKLLLEELGRSGAVLVTAPLDVSSEHPTFARESVFYAARDFGPDTASAVRDSIYKGTQDRGLQFATTAHVITWLQSDLPALLDSPGWARLGRRADSSAVRQAIGRAVRLSLGAGVDELPAYLLLHEGRVKALFDRGSFPAPALLRERLLERVKTLSKQ